MSEERKKDQNKDQNFDAVGDQPTEVIPQSEGHTIDDGGASIPKTEMVDAEHNATSEEHFDTKEKIDSALTPTQQVTTEESDFVDPAGANGGGKETVADENLANLQAQSRWEAFKRELHLGTTRRKILAGSAIGLLLLGGIGVAAHETIEHATRHAVHTEFERQHGHHDRPGRAHHEHGRHGHERDGRYTERPGHERDAEDPTLTRTDSPRGDAPQSSDRAQSGDNAQSSDTAQSGR